MIILLNSGQKKIVPILEISQGQCPWKDFRINPDLSGFDRFFISCPNFFIKKDKFFIFKIFIFFFIFFSFFLLNLGLIIKVVQNES